MNAESSLAVDAQGIARRFGARWCLRGVSLHVRPGEVVALAGTNGSGKTTFLRVVATLLKPNAGTVKVYGHDVTKAPDEVRRHVGFLAHAAGLYEDLTALENLRFAAEMLGRSPNGLEAALDRVGLARVAGDRVRGFSAGMQRRLALARLMLVRPRLLLLDEPYANLDTAGTEIINGVITEVRNAGGAALLVLHELAPAAGMLDRVLTLVDGRIAAEGGDGPTATASSAPATIASPAGAR
jgi:heme exporter protein A